MLKTQPLHRIGQLDVDCQVVGIELELVARAKRGALIDGHEEPRDAAAIFGQLQFPMTVSTRMSLEGDRIHNRHSTYRGSGRKRYSAFAKLAVMCNILHM